MPDFRGQDVQARKLGTAQRRSWRAKLVRYSKIVNKRGRAAFTNRLKQKYLPNKWHARGLDQSLKSGSGLCLADFVQSGGARALAPGERRYAVEAARLPEVLQTGLNGRVKRMLVKSAGKKRLERRSENHRRILHMHVDQGPENCVFRFWLLQCKGLVGWLHPDALHRQNNNCMQACKDAGVFWTLRDMTLLGSIGAAPWGQSGNYAKYMEAAQQYTANFDETDHLFTTLYPWLAWLNTSGDLPANWRTSAAMKEHWIDFECFSLYGSRGEKAKRSRWFQSCRRWREMRSSAGHVLLSILYLGLQSDWWGDLGSSPWRVHEQSQDEARCVMRERPRTDPCRSLAMDQTKRAFLLFAFPF
eukprot:6490506-Amphidinium_carterae.1